MDNVEVNTIGTQKNNPLEYAPGSKHHHLNMSTIGRHVGWLYIYIYIERETDKEYGIYETEF